MATRASKNPCLPKAEIGKTGVGALQGGGGGTNYIYIYIYIHLYIYIYTFFRSVYVYIHTHLRVDMHACMHCIALHCIALHGMHACMHAYLCLYTMCNNITTYLNVKQHNVVCYSITRYIMQ